MLGEAVSAVLTRCVVGGAVAERAAGGGMGEGWAGAAAVSPAEEVD